MADRKISDLTALTTPASGDFLPIVDISEAAAASKNKRITIEELMRGVPDGTAAAPGIAFETDPNTGIYSPGADQLAVSTGGAERARIDPSGRLLVGPTASSIPTAGSNGGLQLHNVTNDNGALLSIVRFNTDTGGPVLVLGKSKSATVAAGAVVANNDSLGTISFVGDDGADLASLGASISCSVDGTPGANDMPGRLVFATTADGVATPTERLRITSAGLVGIGTTSPATTLDVNGDVTIADKIIHASDTNTAIRFPAADTVSVETSGSERIRVDSSGRLLIGTNTSRSSQFGAYPYSAQLQIEGSSADLGGSAYSRFSDDDVPTGLSLQKARGTKALPVIVNDNDTIGFIGFSGYDGAKWVNSAGIWAEVQGTPGVDDMPGRLVFATTPDGALFPVEAMRINSAQELLIGYTTDNGAYKLQVNSQIFATSATVATSDGRYKENVATLNGCIDLVNALRPVSFDWKPQQDITRIDEDGNSVLVREGHNFPDGKQVGFIAQEVQEVLADKPWLGSVIKQNVRPAIEDADGNELAPEEEFFGIAEGNLTAVLTAALQEAIAKIEALEGMVAVNNITIDEQQHQLSTLEARLTALESA
jgi:hypothetical protein